jgi:hypothetical protein
MKQLSLTTAAFSQHRRRTMRPHVAFSPHAPPAARKYGQISRHFLPVVPICAAGTPLAA